MKIPIPRWVKSSVVTVGDGRGFVVCDREFNRSLIITAAHCLLHFPPCHSMSYEDERTYPQLLAPLGQAPAVWAECLFADPIADLAVLGPPDDQELSAQNDAYRELVDSLKPLRIAAVPTRRMKLGFRRGCSRSKVNGSVAKPGTAETAPYGLLKRRSHFVEECPGPQWS